MPVLAWRDCRALRAVPVAGLEVDEDVRTLQPLLYLVLYGLREVVRILYRLLAPHDQVQVYVPLAARFTGAQFMKIDKLAVMLGD